MYNDLKLDNIMVGYNDKLPDYEKMGGRNKSTSCFANCTISIIDFGFATSYYQANQQDHIEQEKLSTFRGNLMFASLSQLQFQTTSRKDDLHSLCYMLYYLLNYGIFSPYKNDKNLSRLENLKACQKLKEAFTVDKMSTGRAKHLKPLFELVFSLDFKEDPDYQAMRQTLFALKKKLIQRSEKEESKAMFGQIDVASPQLGRTGQKKDGLFKELSPSMKGESSSTKRSSKTPHHAKGRSKLGGRGDDMFNSPKFNLENVQDPFGENSKHRRNKSNYLGPRDGSSRRHSR